MNTIGVGVDPICLHVTFVRYVFLDVKVFVHLHFAFDFHVRLDDHVRGRYGDIARALDIGRAHHVDVGIAFHADVQHAADGKLAIPEGHDAVIAAARNFDITADFHGMAAVDKLALVTFDLGIFVFVNGSGCAAFDVGLFVTNRVVGSGAVWMHFIIRPLAMPDANALVSRGIVRMKFVAAFGYFNFVVRVLAFVRGFADARRGLVFFFGHCVWVNPTG